MERNPLQERIRGAEIGRCEFHLRFFIGRMIFFQTHSPIRQAEYMAASKAATSPHVAMPKLATTADTPLTTGCAMSCDCAVFMSAVILSHAMPAFVTDRSQVAR